MTVCARQRRTNLLVGLERLLRVLPLEPRPPGGLSRRCVWFSADVLVLLGLLPVTRSELYQPEGAGLIVPVLLQVTIHEEDGHCHERKQREVSRDGQPGMVPDELLLPWVLRQAPVGPTEPPGPALNQ